MAVASQHDFEKERIAGNLEVRGGNMLEFAHLALELIVLLLFIWPFPYL